MNIHTPLTSIHLSASLCQALLCSGWSTGIGQKPGLLWREEDASLSPLAQEVDKEVYALQPSPGNGFLAAQGFQDCWLGPGNCSHPASGRGGLHTGN